MTAKAPALLGDKVTITRGRFAGREGTVSQLHPDGSVHVHVGGGFGTTCPRDSVRIHGVDVDLTPAQRDAMVRWAKLGSESHTRPATRGALVRLGLCRVHLVGASAQLQLTKAGKTWCRRNVPDGKVK